VNVLIKHHVKKNDGEVEVQIHVFLLSALDKDGFTLRKINPTPQDRTLYV
jgi:hypothetical protein